jgi:hypothetical protein
MVQPQLLPCIRRVRIEVDFPLTRQRQRDPPADHRTERRQRQQTAAALSRQASPEACAPIGRIGKVKQGCISHVGHIRTNGADPAAIRLFSHGSLQKADRFILAEKRSKTVFFCDRHRPVNAFISNVVPVRASGSGLRLNEVATGIDAQTIEQNQS